MPHEPSGHFLILTAGRLYSRNDVGVDNLHAEELLVVVPNLVVHHLPQQLNRALAAHWVHGRQVDVVDEDDELLAQRRTVHTFPSLVKLAHNDVLNQGTRMK